MLDFSLGLTTLQASEKPAEVAVAAPPEKVLVGILWVGMAKMVRMRMRMPTHFAGISFFGVCVDERGFCHVGPLEGQDHVLI